MLRSQVQRLQQEQAPLAEQNRKWLQAREEAARQLAAFRDDNERLNRNSAERLRLRGELARWKHDARVSQASPADASGDAAAKSWLNRVNQLKQYLDENPNEKIPEFQFLLDWQWLSAEEMRRLIQQKCRQVAWTAE
jgi:hypothetical protein